MGFWIGVAIKVLLVIFGLAAIGVRGRRRGGENWRLSPGPRAAGRRSATPRARP